jgi:hypothetical protein
MEYDTKTRKLDSANKKTNLISAAPSVTSDKTSFAYISARDRWPVILVGTIRSAWDMANRKDWRDR